MVPATAAAAAEVKEDAAPTTKKIAPGGSRLTLMINMCGSNSKASNPPN